MSRLCGYHISILLPLFFCNCAGPPQASGQDRALRIASIELTSGQPDVALQSATLVSETSPHNAQAWTVGGDAELALGDNARALASYQRALREDPYNREALFGLAKLEIGPAPQLAVKALLDLIKTSPHEEKLWTDLGVAYDALSRPADAQIAYKAALVQNPFAIAPQIDLGLSMVMSGKVREGAAILAEVAGTPDASPRARQDLALALTLMGQTQAADELLAKDLSPARASAARERLDGLRDVLR